MVLEGGCMRIVALEAVPNRRAVHMAFDLAGVLVGVASQAQLDGCDGGRLDTGNVFAYTQFVAAQASRGDGRMYRLSLGLILVAGDALGGVGAWLQRNRVRFCLRGTGRNQHQ